MDRVSHAILFFSFFPSDPIRQFLRLDENPPSLRIAGAPTSICVCVCLAIKMGEPDRVYIHQSMAPGRLSVRISASQRLVSPRFSFFPISFVLGGNFGI